MKSQYLHMRRVNYSDGVYRIEDKTDRNCQILFHTPCEIHREGNCLLLYYNGVNLCRFSSDCILETVGSKRSLYYLKKTDSTCIVLEAKAGQPINTIIETGGCRYNG